MTSDEIKKQFAMCFKDAEVFTRESASGTFFEVEEIRRSRLNWLVIAAGVSESLAKKLFSSNPARQERAKLPVKVMGGGQLSFAFILRPISFDEFKVSNAHCVTTFAPNREIPLVQLEDSFFHLSNIPDNGSRLAHLRWELDSTNSFRQPNESWLHPWKNALSFNPAHPPSHLHINQTPIDDYESSRDASNHSPDELRLAVGVPNPLALVLSVAAWKR